jgi:hypothetical protein
LRGRFREVYRRALDLFTPGFVELARRACEAGVLRQLDDAFFLPLETADDLACAEPLRWLESAIAANRREYTAILGAAEPGDLLERAERSAVLPDRGRSGSGRLCCRCRRRALQTKILGASTAERFSAV